MIPIIYENKIAFYWHDLKNTPQINQIIPWFDKAYRVSERQFKNGKLQIIIVLCI